MNEKQLLLEISHITNRSVDFAEALEQVGRLIDRELGGRGLAVSQLEDSFRTANAAVRAEEFFDGTAHLPCRSLYAVTLRANGREIGRLVAFFACADSNDGLRQRVSGFAGEQLGVLLQRLRLAKQRRALRAEASRIRVNLAMRKALQRAEGILARRGLDASSARAWLRREALKKRISTVQMANQLFEREARRVEVRYVEEPVALQARLSA